MTASRRRTASSVERGLFDLDIHVLAFALDTYAQRGGKGHDHVGAEAFGEDDGNFSPPDGFLEISHDIQMTDEFHGSVFGKFHSNLHSIHLRRRIFRRSLSSPGGSWVSRYPVLLSPIPVPGISG